MAFWPVIHASTSVKMSVDVQYQERLIKIRMPLIQWKKQDLREDEGPGTPDVSEAKLVTGLKRQASESWLRASQVQHVASSS